MSPACCMPGTGPGPMPLQESAMEARPKDYGREAKPGRRCTAQSAAYFEISIPSEEISVIPVGKGIGVSVSMLSVFA